MAHLDNDTLQIVGTVEPWPENEDLDRAEKVAENTHREYLDFVGGAGSLSDSTPSDDRPSVEIDLWNAYMRALAKVKRLREEYDLHADRSEASRHDAEVDAHAESAQA